MIQPLSSVLVPFITLPYVLAYALSNTARYFVDLGGGLSRTAMGYAHMLVVSAIVVGVVARKTIAFFRRLRDEAAAVQEEIRREK